MIHDEICTYEVCQLAKEKGFPQHIGDDAYIADNEYYDDTFIEGYLDRIEFIPDYYPTVTAPTQSLLQRWLREEKRIETCAVWDNRDGKWVGYVNEMDMPDLVGEYVLSDTYVSYELALEDALKYALKNLV